MLLLTGCYKDTLDEPIIHNVYTFDDKISTDVLSVCNAIGDVTITNSDNENVKVSVDLVQSKNLDDIDKKLGNIFVNPKLDNGVVFYEPLCKNDETRDFWEWSSKELNDNGISVNFNIEIPSTIKEVRVYDSIGDIDFKDITAKIYAQTDIGQITGSNITPLDNGTFKVNCAINKNEICKLNFKLDDNGELKVNDPRDNAGINLNFASIDEANNIIAGTKSGIVKLDIPSNSNYVKKEAEPEDIGVEYPSTGISDEYVDYCREQGMKSSSLNMEKANKTVVTTTTNKSK